MAASEHQFLYGVQAAYMSKIRNKNDWAAYMSKIGNRSDWAAYMTKI